ncbi:MAG: hypothetical protein US04_C0001G0120 [Candidatus Nomurabacteria bacterium GW2011_GWD2_36_14]|nr:MAG: hypothetical protein UR97_C0004G0123 [Candidatus Nomurabacteria bacterium GW2011_GWE2_36_115]KKP94254.1 MAG: hypothetical protein US00_C0003G0178 [Candidatus Nomurabacteria bacterium GW2011_GWF2_36_126]KKP96618.1 MAG: hypothetical protein US04_C0001G0120 [Candidatus Nomurabacteria bacterium GW2011_GWD2_36_14]KKP99778.1 MAG: hypothetical protein US08_C0001G0461 [Candidatus Nomurabacteria bacterium GW2011_GWF2_36_19]KKQ05276.1 MAG: hypothetical protein US17_C0005G0043 [Candidatus Nomuraba
MSEKNLSDTSPPSEDDQIINFEDNDSDSNSEYSNFNEDPRVFGSDDFVEFGID